MRFVDTCTIASTVVSLFGFGYTLYQIWRLKGITKESQKRVEQEVTSAQKNIKSGLAINNVGSLIKVLGETINHVNQNKYEIASLRMGDIEPSIEEIINDDSLGLTSSSRQKQSLKEYREVMTSLITYSNQPGKINQKHVVSLLTGIRTELVKIHANLKKSLYESTKN